MLDHVRNRAAGTLVPVKHRRHSNIWVYVPRYQPCLYMCAFQCIGHMVEGSGWRLCIPGSIPVGAIFPLSVCLELEPAGCPEHWSSGHLVLEERAESSPPLPATGSLTCAPALASVSVSSLQGAAFNWGRCLPSTVVVLPPGPGRTVAGDRDLFCFDGRGGVDAEQSTMRKSEWRSFIRRAEPNLSAYALPMPRIFFRRYARWPGGQWPMMRRVAVAGATRALRCRDWHEIRVDARTDR